MRTCSICANTSIPLCLSRYLTRYLTRSLFIFGMIGLSACDDQQLTPNEGQSPDTQAPRWGEEATLDVTQLDQRSLRLSWRYALDDRGVEAYRVALDGAEVTRMPGEARQLSLTELEPDRAYTLALSALDAAQNESEPLTADITLSSATEPTIEPTIEPQGWRAGDTLSVGVEEGADATSAVITLGWPNISSEDTGYLVSHNGAEVWSGSGTEATLEGIPRGQWHSFEVRAVDEATQTPLGQLSERVFIGVDLAWPEGAALEIEQPQALREIRLRWPSPSGASLLTDPLRYQVSIGDMNAIEVDHAQGEVQALTLSPVPEGEELTISVTLLIGEERAATLAALTAPVTGLDRTPPQWPASASLSLNLTRNLDDVNLYTLMISAPLAQDLVGVSGYRATLGGEPLDVTWRDEDQGALGEATLTPEEASARYGMRVNVVAFDHAGLESAPLTAQLTPPQQTSIEWPIWAQLRVTASDAESLTLSWPPALVSGVETALRYQVSLDGVEVAMIDHMNEPARSITVSGLTPARDYQAEVIALDSNDARSPGLTALVSTSPYEQPRWADDAAVNLEELDHERAVISWPLAGERAYTQRYLVLHRGEVLAEVSAADVVDGLARVELDGLTPLTMYTLEVDAEGAGGDHALTPLTTTFETLARPTMLWPEESALTAIPLSDTELELSWPAWSGDEAVAMYVIYQDLTQYAEVTPESAGAAPRFVITDLRPRSESRWRVQARGVAGGFSHNGPEALITQPDTQPPTWPDTTLTVVEVTATTLEVSWSPALDLDAVAAYLLSLDGEVRLNLGAEARSARLEGLVPGEQHLVALHAVDVAGNMSEGGPESLVTLPSLVPLRTDEEIMQGLAPTCGVCHGGCPQCLDDWFSSVEQFRAGIVNDPSVITPGAPEESLLLHLLRGTDSGLWGQMPPSYFEDGATFVERRARGETSLTVAEVERWIEELAAP